MYIWKIEGEASDNSGGGSTVIFTITDCNFSPPDVDKALREADPSCAWYRIDKISLVGKIPRSWVSCSVDDPLSELELEAV
jgi:hypothetical protein